MLATLVEKLSSLSSFEEDPVDQFEPPHPNELIYIIEIASTFALSHQKAHRRRQLQHTPDGNSAAVGHLVHSLYARLKQPQSISAVSSLYLCLKAALSVVNLSLDANALLAEWQFWVERFGNTQIIPEALYIQAVRLLLKMRRFDQARQFVTDALRSSPSTLPLSRNFKLFVQREILLFNNVDYSSIIHNHDTSSSSGSVKGSENYHDDQVVEEQEDDAISVNDNGSSSPPAYSSSSYSSSSSSFVMLSAEERQELIDSLEFETSRGKDLLSFIVSNPTLAKSAKSSPPFGNSRRKTSYHRVDEDFLALLRSNRHDDF